MESKTDADKKDEISEASSIQALIHSLHPGITAQYGSNVVAPTIIDSNVGTININITRNGHECEVSPGFTSTAESCEFQQQPGEQFMTSSHEGVGIAHKVSKNKYLYKTFSPAGVSIAQCQRKLRAELMTKFSFLLEGGATETKKIPLHKIFTELYITEGGSAKVNLEHEVRQIEATSRRHVAQEKSIHCTQLFAAQPGQNHNIRTVITRGVAGIGKTVCVKKFTLDWAEGRANTELDFVFPLTFRELNLMRKKTSSLADLLHLLFPDTKNTDIFSHANSRMLFILDGLDESRLSMDFHKGEIVSDVTQPARISVLLINLIRGRLLPSSLVWITSRPAASGQIPEEDVDLVTEVRGFNNQQKDEYFRRKIDDQNLANRVITHVKSCRSLHIMCHIPVFCWMAASVLEKMLVTNAPGDTPKTLTRMYINFLSLYVEKTKKRLSERRESSTESIRTNLLSLGKLAYRELEKGHLIFYEKDLIKNGLGVTQASMFSGLYTQIFSEELMLGEQMFCFVHLSIQEFFAALYVFLTFNNDNINVLVTKSLAERLFLFRDSSELVLYKDAVEKALRCENGYFDIFLRFLLGLSMESNQVLLKQLLTTNRTNKRTRTAIITYIKEKIKSSPSSERCLNLFHCLNELNDHSLVEEVQSFFRSGSLREVKLSPAQWSTLVYVLLTSEEELSVFELSNYSRSEEGLSRLLPVLKTAQAANLNACNLTVTCCEMLASCISSSQIRELNLGNNNLTDLGMSLLSAGLKNSKLETLRMRSCSMTKLSSDALAEMISSASCQLKVLDLSDNDLEDEGVTVFSTGLGNSCCKLETLSLSLCRVTETGCTFLASALTSSSLRELDLSYNHPGTLGLQLLKALQNEPHCSLQELCVEECGESRVQPGPKKYHRKLTLDPKTAHKDLFLSMENTKAKRWTAQPYPDQPERFDHWRQVLCTEGLTGRCYWGVVWSGRVSIGVAYRGMDRKGEGHNSWLGRNESSWSLNCTKDGYRASHKDTSTVLAAQASSNEIGVFLDWSGGTLSFYQVSSGSPTLLHTFHTSFTEPVFPGFQLAWVDATIQLCQVCGLDPPTSDESCSVIVP
ncbi:NLR family CARD domain-containing protein 3-like isoform X3 [Cynoglossus semilaevis]|uniref:NLR family CARD domain-containing protein 3-like isoform X3 n=1 Tax=Cynoglossus semilaevis TaxID=244447 RepID=UPI000D63062F|nr:NLR family CARD domain-containing protein 3-like isoform X3 [Cynoglossus semilaevis]